jgi:hypothetical protein
MQGGGQKNLKLVAILKLRVIHTLPIILIIEGRRSEYDIIYQLWMRKRRIIIRYGGGHNEKLCIIKISFISRSAERAKRNYEPFFVAIRFLGDLGVEYGDDAVGLAAEAHVLAHLLARQRSLGNAQLHRRHWLRVRRRLLMMRCKRLERLPAAGRRERRRRRLLVERRIYKRRK